MSKTLRAMLIVRMTIGVLGCGPTPLDGFGVSNPPEADAGPMVSCKNPGEIFVPPPPFTGAYRCAQSKIYGWIWTSQYPDGGWWGTHPVMDGGN